MVTLLNPAALPDKWVLSEQKISAQQQEKRSAIHLIEDFFPFLGTSV